MKFEVFITDENEKFGNEAFVNHYQFSNHFYEYLIANQGVLLCISLPYQRQPNEVVNRKKMAKKHFQNYEAFVSDANSIQSKQQASFLFSFGNLAHRTALFAHYKKHVFGTNQYLKFLRHMHDHLSNRKESMTSMI